MNNKQQKPSTSTQVVAQLRPLFIENYAILNKRNVPTRRITTLATWRVLFFLFLGLLLVGRNSLRLSTDVCGADMSPTFHTTQQVKKKHRTKAQKLMKIANITTQYNSIDVIIEQTGDV